MTREGLRLLEEWLESFVLSEVARLRRPKPGGEKLGNIIFESESRLEKWCLREPGGLFEP